MSSSQAQAILALLKLDLEAVYERVVGREKEYMRIFSAERSRDHFEEIFYTRFFDFLPSDLKVCSPEVIIELDRFYKVFERIRWYLRHTEDMPQTAESRVEHFVKELKGLYPTVTLYLDAQLDSSKREES